ncbi:MAG: methyltransferase [Bacteroidales bacterium]|nr:methyltransferase [Bacteroidales bacterium]
MSNSYFQFKQFTIRQDKCAMKVGTDGVLLGAWCPVKKNDVVLDIGTGTGLIALMVAQRGGALIHAVDIDASAVEQAKENVSYSPWNHQIEVFESDVQHFDVGVRYDVVVSNPPYFNNSLKNPNKCRMMARHTDSLSYDDLILSSVKLLKPTGIMCVILPYDESLLFIEKAKAHEFYLQQDITIKTTLTTEKASRRMMAFIRSSIQVLHHNEIVLFLDEKQMSESYRNLVKPYYLFV